MRLEDHSCRTAREIFAQAHKIDDTQARDEFLDRACGCNSDLREEVEGLLAAHAELDSGLLDRAVDRFGPLQSLTLKPGELLTSAAALPFPRIERFKLREQIGEGGMGIVYVADQLEPVRRTVAIKVVKPGMDTREVIGRFEAERQALALMDHPHIARVLDAGTTAEGRPFFVMELVKGIPITDYCDQAQLGTRARLKLFLKVCQAVEHAHQKGVIHRDLKPGNVLVTLHDGTAVPKVIDFGVAKALNQRLTEHTIYTQFRQIIGTPAYMSPEQAALSGLDVDTRSDVYSLGVLLYELLTGTTPFSKEELTSKGFDEMRRIIREKEPLRPSERVTTLGSSERTSFEQSRGVEAGDLGRALRRELDWIVMRALEKDRGRRYQSVSELADDLRRYLLDEPVLACPPSAAYRLRKTAKRNKMLIAATSLVLITALVGIISTLRYARRSAETAALAQSAQAEAERHALDAEQARQRAQTMLYTADMKLASDAVFSADMPRAAELLERHIPQPGETDRRGLEWHYLHKCIAAPTYIDLQQDDWPNDVEVSPDGARLACSIRDEGIVRLVDTTTWQTEGSIRTGPVQNDGLSWSPDGEMIAAAGDDGIVRICNVDRGAVERSIVAHRGEANDVAFGPHGATLYTCGDDNVARKWDVASGLELTEYRGHERAIEGLALAPDGCRLATASSDKSFAIYDTASGERLHHFLTDRLAGRVTSVTFSPDGRLLAAANIYGKIFLTDIETGTTELLKKQPDGIEELEFIGAGRWLAIADRGGAIELLAVPAALWQLRATESTASVRWIAHEGRAISLTAGPDGKYLVSGGRDSRVKVWSPDIESRRWVVQPGFESREGQVERDIAVGSGNRLYVADESLSIWDLAERRVIERIPAPMPPWDCVASSADGRFLAAACRGRLLLFDQTSMEVVREWGLDDRVANCLAISSDGSMIAVGCLKENEAFLVFDRRSPQSVRVDNVLRTAYHTISPDRRWLATGYENQLRFLNLSTHEVRDLTGHTNTMISAAFSPDGRLIASVSHDRTLKVWDVEAGNLLFSIVAHRDMCNDVVFSPDGRTILTAGKDGQIKLWHTETGQPLGSMTREFSAIRKLRITRDGNHVVAVMSDQWVVAFDASAAAELSEDVSTVKFLIEQAKQPGR